MVQMPGKAQVSTDDTMLRNVGIAVSLLAGLAFPIIDGRFGAVADVGVKGLAVGALAIAAALSPGPARYWLAAIMACGALGDMLLEIPGQFTSGGAAFAAGHVIAIVLYLRHRRTDLWAGDALIAAALIAYGAALPSLVLSDTEATGSVMLYSVLLCAMAAATWLGRFPHRFVTSGALLFMLSDTFLLLRMGGLEVNGSGTHGGIVWFSYYFGQLLIFIGINHGAQRGSSTPTGRRN